MRLEMTDHQSPAEETHPRKNDILSYFLFRKESHLQTSIISPVKKTQTRKGTQNGERVNPKDPGETAQ
jgi:hypothetical protein